MTVLHVYGVVRSGHPVPAGLTGVAGDPVRLVASGRVAAAVSDLADDLVPGPTEVGAHATVLDELLATGAVLPLRFGVAMPDEATVRSDLLRRNERRLLRGLDRLAGYVEFNVKAFAREEAALDEVVRSSDRVRRAARRSGTDLMSRVELGEVVAAELEAVQAAGAARIVAALRPLAEAVAAGAAVPGVVLNTSFLVRADGVEPFLAAADRAAAGERTRMDIRCAGPLPAYSFVDQATGVA